MVRAGVGVVHALREVAKRFSQRAVIDLLDRQFREFVIDAGVAIELLAKAIVASNDPPGLFEIRKYEEPLTSDELAVLDPHLQNQLPRRLHGDEVDAVRALLSRRQTISARKAFNLASTLGGIRHEWLAPAIERIAQARDAAIHFGDEPVIDLGLAADDFVRVAERFWADLGRPRTKLWGWATDVAHVSDWGVECLRSTLEPGSLWRGTNSPRSG